MYNKKLSTSVNIQRFFTVRILNLATSQLLFASADFSDIREEAPDHDIVNKFRSLGTTIQISRWSTPPLLIRSLQNDWSSGRFPVKPYVTEHGVKIIHFVKIILPETCNIHVTHGGPFITVRFSSYLRLFVNDLQSVFRIINVLPTIDFR